MAPWSSFETKVAIAFGAATLVVGALTASTWKIANDAALAARMEARTHEVLNDLARTRGYSLQAELTTQNFRLTGDPSHLVERDEAMSAREQALKSIGQLTNDNPAQQRRWAELLEIVKQRKEISQKVEALRKTKGQIAADAFAATAPLKATRTRTYQLLGEMDLDARQRLSQREAAHSKARLTLVRSGALVATVLVILLCGTYVLIRRQLRATEASQRALADSEEKLSTTLHSLGDAVLATDINGCVTRMNPVAERLTGWPLSQAVGTPIGDVFHILHEETREPAPIPVTAVLATGETQVLADHAVLIAKDGVERPIADSAAPIRDASGELRGVVLVFRDVTTERNAERIVREQNAMLAADVLERTARWHESESHLHNIINAVPALIAYVNAERRYVYVNAQYQQRFAPDREDLAGRAVHDILGPDRYAVANTLIDKVLKGDPQAYDWEPFPGVWQAIQYVPRHHADGGVEGYYVLGTDITERKHFEERIQTLNSELEQRLHKLEQVSRALRTLSAGNRTMLRASEEQSLLESMCQSIVTAGGYGMAVVWYRSEGLEQPLEPMAECRYPGGLDALRSLSLSLTDPQKRKGLTPIAIRHGHVHLVRNIDHDPDHLPWRNQLAGFSTGLSCPLHVDGEVIGALSIYDPQPDAFGASEVTLLTESADDLAFGISTLRARKEQQRVQAAMNRMMRYDALTGLPNAVEFEEALGTIVDFQTTPLQPMAALQLNIERLGEINDVLGYAHGDQLLKDFGQRLRDCLPSSSLVARLRGDEFAVLTPAKNAAEALERAQELEDCLACPFPIADLELDVTAKIGIALYPEHGETSKVLMRRMGKALYQAKADGLSYRLYDPSQQQDHIGRLKMAGELRRAFSGDQMRLYLQPKVEMASGRVCGAEALVRWQHPEHGLVMPGAFIGLAEQTGLIKPLTEWVTIAALDLLQVWQTQGGALPIAINLSARNFRDEQLLSKYRTWHAHRDISPGLLEVEITESTVMDDAEYALRVLYSLREEGIPLYVDDFGTGYSSLSYLQRLPVDYIKIDQSFVAAMTLNKDSAAIVRSTIDLAHDLGCKTVAEGVETREQWELLARLGCDIAQGYFIAKPMPSDMFQQWAAEFKSPNLPSSKPHT